LIVRLVTAPQRILAMVLDFTLLRTVNIATAAYSSATIGS
jgi:hypothetical protein